MKLRTMYPLTKAKQNELTVLWEVQKLRSAQDTAQDLAPTHG